MEKQIIYESQIQEHRFVTDDYHNGNNDKRADRIHSVSAEKRFIERLKRAAEGKLI